MFNEVAINQFIQDFKLRQPDGVIGFAAKVLFHINGHTKIRYTEVQILKGQELNAIYLIAPDLPFEDLPDTFILKDFNFEYVEGHRLEVTSKKEKQNVIEIIPVVISE